MNAGNRFVPLRTGWIVFPIIGVMSLTLGVAGCQPDSSLQSAEASDGVVDAGGVVDAIPLAPFMRTEDGFDVDPGSLTIGDRIVFRIPESGLSAARVIEMDDRAVKTDARVVETDACMCIWDVEPGRSGSFAPPSSCTTTYTALKSGEITISVTQTCLGTQPRNFTERVVVGDADSDVGVAGVSETNAAPIVNLNRNIFAEAGSLVLLDASDSKDPEGAPLTFEWIQTFGRKVTLSDADTSLASFTAPEVEEYEALEFKVLVRNGSSTTAAEVRVEIDTLLNVAGFVFADAGEDLTADAGERVLLDGTGSSGIAPGAMAFRWAQLAGAEVVLEDTDKAVASFVAPPAPPGGLLLRFQLTVEEGELLDSTDVFVSIFSPDIDGGDGSDGNGDAGETPAECGNGIVEPGESCDDGAASASCDADCSPAFCGDGVVNPLAGEECDDGNLICGDGCGGGCEIEDTQLSGACCRSNGVCDMVSQASQCTQTGGVFMGFGVSCCAAGCPNIAPGVLDVYATTETNSAIELTLVGTDPGASVGGQTLTFSIVSPTCHGSLGAIEHLSPTTARVTYTPNTNFRGKDRFTFSTTDGEAISTPGLGVVTVGGHHPLRMIWSSASSSIVTDGSLANMLADGITDFATKVPSLGNPVGQADRIRLETWSNALASEDARLWVIFNWFALNEQFYFADHDMTWEVYVTPEGVSLPNTPCPTSQEFWDFAITGRALALLRAANPGDASYVPKFDDVFEGIVIDLELYSSEYDEYEAPCYCDRCFGDFLASLGPANPLPPGDPIPVATERFNFLVTHSTSSLDLVLAYDDFEERSILELVTQFREDVHSIDPCFKLASTASIREASFYRGFTRGIGTRRSPYYELSQRFLGSGYTGSVVLHQQDIMDRGLHVELIVGLWFLPFDPLGLVDHYYVSAIQTGGVWLNRADSYQNNGADLCHDFSDYRDAVSAGNAELDAFENDADHQSQYTGAPFAPGCVDSDAYGVGSSLVPVDPSGETVDVGPLIRRETGYYFHVDSSNQDVSFDILFRRFGAADQTNGWWALMSPDGEVLASDPLSDQNSVTTPGFSPSRVRYTVSGTGVYALIVNTASIHGFQITNPSHPGGYQRILSNGRLGLYKADMLETPIMYVYVPAGVTSVELSLFASTGEPTRIQIYDERANQFEIQSLFNAVVTPSTGTVDLTLPLGNAAGGDGVVLEVHFINPPPYFGAEDLGIGVVSGALPYIAQTRSGLLRVP